MNGEAKSPGLSYIAMARQWLGYSGNSQKKAKHLLKLNEKKTAATGQVPGPILNGTQMTPYECAPHYHKQHVIALRDTEVQACKLTGNTINACIDIYSEISRRAFSKADIAVDHPDYESILKGTQVVFSSDSITKPEAGAPPKSAGDHQSNFLVKAFPNGRGFPRKPLQRNNTKVKDKLQRLKKWQDVYIAHTGVSSHMMGGSTFFYKSMESAKTLIAETAVMQLNMIDESTGQVPDSQPPVVMADNHPSFWNDEHHITTTTYSHVKGKRIKVIQEYIDNFDAAANTCYICNK